MLHNPLGVFTCWSFIACGFVNQAWSFALLRKKDSYIPAPSDFFGHSFPTNNAPQQSWQTNTPGSLGNIGANQLWPTYVQQQQAQQLQLQQYHQQQQRQLQLLRQKYFNQYLGVVTTPPTTTAAPTTTPIVFDGQQLNLAEAAYVAGLNETGVGIVMKPQPKLSKRKRRKKRKRLKMTARAVRALQSLPDTALASIINVHSGGQVRLTTEKAAFFRSVNPQVLADFINAQRIDIFGILDQLSEKTDAEFRRAKVASRRASKLSRKAKKKHAKELVSKSVLHTPEERTKLGEVTWRKRTNNAEASRQWTTPAPGKSESTTSFQSEEPEVYFPTNLPTLAASIRPPANQTFTRPIVYSNITPESTASIPANFNGYPNLLPNQPLGYPGFYPPQLVSRTDSGLSSNVAQNLPYQPLPTTFGNPPQSGIINGQNSGQFYPKSFFPGIVPFQGSAPSSFLTASHQLPQRPIPNQQLGYLSPNPFFLDSGLIQAKPTPPPRRQSSNTDKGIRTERPYRFGKLIKFPNISRPNKTSGQFASKRLRQLQAKPPPPPPKSTEHRRMINNIGSISADIADSRSTSRNLAAAQGIRPRKTFVNSRLSQLQQTNTRNNHSDQNKSAAKRVPNSYAAQGIARTVRTTSLLTDQEISMLASMSLEAIQQIVLNKAGYRIGKNLAKSVKDHLLEQNLSKVS